jgi:uncharacterized protein YjbI with pentapeptide repeats
MMIGQKRPMSNPEHVAKVKEGQLALNKWRTEHPEIILDLSRAELPSINLTGANLGGADFTDADLTGGVVTDANLTGATLAFATLSAATLENAILEDANLYSANLNRTNLRGVKFIGANLANAILTSANLNGSNLTGTNLGGTNFSGAILDDCDFTGTRMGRTYFGDNNLSLVKGLEFVEHTSSSTIDILTIYRSQGQIPRIFMRGCGVPDDFITYMKSLAASPIEFYSCFISYSFKDQDFADRLYADLQNKGVRCWFAPHHMKAGEKLNEQIDEAIRLYDKLLLILSPHSMESEWVKTEIAKARKREVRDKRKVLFPISLVPFKAIEDWECFDADTGKDSAREIREYFIPDFSNWKDHDSYQVAFTRLIADLKASDSKPLVAQPRIQASDGPHPSKP